MTTTPAEIAAAITSDAPPVMVMYEAVEETTLFLTRDEAATHIGDMAVYDDRSPDWTIELGTTPRYIDKWAEEVVEEALAEAELDRRSMYPMRAGPT